MVDRLQLKVFVSSPGDVAEERALAGQVLQRLAREYRDSVDLVVVQWEHEPLFAHTGFQEQIERPSQCDLVVSILWSRLGTRLPGDYAPAPGAPAPTGTEFELNDALEAHRRLGRPNILIYRKTTAPLANLASSETPERLRQYEMLDAFCKRIFVDAQGDTIAAHHLYEEAYEFERKLTEHVHKWIEGAVGAANARPRWTDGSPFRGLQVFQATHREIFFGRAEAVSELTKRMRETEARAASAETVLRFLLVQGMSGNGKSSLIHAGLLPLLEGRALEGIGLWQTLICKPSDRSAVDPESGLTGVLAEGLLRALPALAESHPQSAMLTKRLREAPDESVARLDGYLGQEAIRKGLKPEQIRLVVFIDQLEELFNPSVTAAMRASIAKLLHAFGLEGRIWVIATLRSDFVSRLEEDPTMVALATQGQVYSLGPPRSYELGLMIREPALAAGLEWEIQDGVSLDQTLQSDAEMNPESLPLLEYALDKLYERQSNRRLTYAAYAELKGLKGGIAETAEAVLRGQGEAGTEALPRLLRSLVSVETIDSPTRRYATITEFATDTTERALLEALIERRLCVTDRKGADSVVSFAHEALIQSWPRVKDWLKEEAELLAIRERMTREARLWEERNCPDGLLGTAPEKVADAKRVKTAGIRLNDVSNAFVLRSIARARRNTFLRHAATAAACLAIAAIAVTTFIAARRQHTAQNAVAALFEAKAWDTLALGTGPRAWRYAIAAYVTAGGSTEELGLVLNAIGSSIRPAALVSMGRAVEVEDFSRSTESLLTLREKKVLEIWDLKKRARRWSVAAAGVTDASFTPDGSHFVTTSVDHIARAWDAASGRSLYPFSSKNTKFPADWTRISPKGNLLVTGSDDHADHSICIWNIRSGQLVAKIDLAKDLTGLAFFPDESKIITVADEKFARIWSTSGGGPVGILPDAGGALSVDISADAKVIAVGSDDGTVTLWDAASGHTLRVIEPGNYVSGVLFSPDGTRLLTRSQLVTSSLLADRNVVIGLWTVYPGTLLAKLEESAGQASPTFSSKGSEVITTSDNGDVHVSDTDIGWKLAVMHLESGHVAASFLDDAGGLVTFSNTGDVRLWQVPRPLWSFRVPGVKQLAVSTPVPGSDSRDLVAVSEGPNTRLLKSDSGAVVAKLISAQRVETASFSPDHRRIATASGDETVQIWDATKGAELVRIPVHAQATHIAWSHDGKLLVTGAGRKVAVWDALDGHKLTDVGSIASYPGETKEEVERLEGRLMNADVREVSFTSDDQRVIVLIGSEGYVQLWSVADRNAKAVDLHEQGDYYVASIASLNGSLHLVTADTDGSARIWDPDTGGEMYRMQMRRDSNHLMAISSADGKRVLTADEFRIGIWDSSTGKQIAELPSAGLESNLVRFSSSGRWALTISGQVINIWATDQAREVASWATGSAIVETAWLDDDRQILTESEDGTIQVWAMPVQDGSTEGLARHLCSVMNSTDGQFSKDEQLQSALFLRKDIPRAFDPDQVCAGVAH